MTNRSFHISHSHSRGSALIAVIIFAVIMSLSAAFAYRSTIFQNRMAHRSYDYLVALNVAEAGAELAMIELNKTPGSAFMSWGGSNPRTNYHAYTDHAGNKLGEAYIQVDNSTGDPRVIATGYVPDKDNARVMRTVQLSTKSNTVGSPWGEFGLFAFGDLSFKGGINIQSYMPDNPNVNTNKATVGALGNISFEGSTTIHGNIHAGKNLVFPSGSFNIKGNAYYGGNLTYPNQWNMPKIDGESKQSSLRTPDRAPVPAKPAYGGVQNNNKVTIRPRNGGGQTKNGISNGESLSISNSTVNFPAPGVYKLSSFQNNNNSHLNITGSGEVKIFVDNNFDLSAIETTTIGPAKPGDPAPQVTLVTKDAKFMQYGTVNLEKGSSLSVFADTFTINGSKAVLMDNDSKFVVSAKNIDAKGGAKINAGLWNQQPGKSQNVELYASTNAEFSQGAWIAGILYAPDAKVAFTGGFDWWGAVIGKNIDVHQGPGVRVNETLFTPSSGSGSYVTAWTEVPPKKI